MAKNALLFALIPLVLFWAVEEYFGLKAALIVGSIAAVIELTYEKIKYKKISFMTLVSNGLVLGLGAVSYVMDSGVAFKLQPAVMELGMAFVMIATRFKGEPFIVRTFQDFKGLDLEKKEAIMKQSWFIKRLKSLDHRMVIFLILHGLALIWAALYGSTRIWILLKGVLFYVLLVVVMLPMYKRPNLN